MNRPGAWVRDRGLTLLGPLLFLGGWEAAVRLGFLSQVLYPPPSLIAERILDLFRGDEELLTNVVVTVRRLALTSGLAAIAGVLVGFVIALFRAVGRGVETLLSLFYPVPAILFLPIISFQFGRTEATLLLTAAVTPFIIMSVATAFGVRQLDPLLIEAGRNFGAERGRFLTRVLLPGSMPSIAAGFRVSLGFSLITVVALEMVMSRGGLGDMLWLSWRILRVRDTYVALVLVAILGFVATRGFNALATRAMPGARLEVDR